MKCGRELRDGAEKCKGCGWSARRRKEKKTFSFDAFSKLKVKEMFSRETKLFGWRAWQVMVFAGVAMAALAAVGLSAPGLLARLPESATESPSHQSDSDVWDGDSAPAQKTGLLLMLDEDERFHIIHDAVNEEGICYTEIEIGSIRVKIQRLPASDGTLEGQMHYLYPSLTGEILYAGGDRTYGGEYHGSLWHISAEEATGGMAVDVLYIQTGEYDQIMQVEVPAAAYPSSEGIIGDLFASVFLAELD